MLKNIEQFSEVKLYDDKNIYVNIVTGTNHYVYIYGTAYLTDNMNGQGQRKSLIKRKNELSQQHRVPETERSEVGAGTD